MAFFGLKTYFKKNFLGYFCPPIKVLSTIWVKMAFKLVFIGVGRICPPPPPQPHYCMPVIEELKRHENKYLTEVQGTINTKIISNAPKNLFCTFTHKHFMHNDNF